MPKKKNTENLLDFIPEIQCNWEKDNQGTISLVIPRFKNRFMKKIAVKLGKSEKVKIHLDEKGSNTWKLIDGFSTIEAIGERLEKEENENREQFYQRLGEFFIILAKNRFIRFKSTS